MRYAVLFSLFLCLFFRGEKIHAQPDRREIWKKVVNDLKVRLDMNDQQTSGVLQAGLERLRRNDSLGTDKALMPDKRTAALRQIHQQFLDIVHRTLSDQQWQKYEAIQAAARDRFMKERNKKVPLTELK